MNPYFTNTYNYPNPTFNPLAYPQSLPAQQARSYTHSVNSIQSMYTTVQPYNNREFLMSTFGSKAQYIQIFLTLSHQDKLKMYLLMQQKKLYGQITDKEAYQKILKQIAQKLHNYNAFHQINQKPNYNPQQTKQHDLESKIDSFCQLSFQKLNMPKIGDNPKGQQVKELEQEWVESLVEDDQPQKQEVPDNRAPAYEKSDNGFNQFYGLESNKQNIKVGEANLASPVYNIFNMDYAMERALTKEIGLKKASQMEKMSIWELQVQQTQVKKYQPNIHQIFKKKQSTHHQPLAQPQIKQTPPSLNTFDLYTQYNNELNTVIQNPPLHSDNVCLMQGSQQQSTSFQNFQFDFTPSSNMEIVNKAVSQQTECFEIKQQINLFGSNRIDSGQNKEDEWQQGFQESKNNNNNKGQQMTNINVQSRYEPPFQQQQVAARAYQAGQNLFDFDGLELKVQVQPQVNSQIFDLYLSNTGKEQAQNNNALQLNVVIPEPQQQIVTMVDLSSTVPSSVPRSELFLPDNQKKYEVLDHLKVQLTQSDKNFISKQLKNKSFQCNTQFYLTIINHLRSLSLQHTPQFQHFNQQYKIVKEMHEVSAKYTTVVDEEDEDKVEQALRESKKLYNKIYNSSNLTQNYSKHILSDSKQKGLEYKLGRVLIDSCINIELVTRASSQENIKNVFNSFCLLYILEKINSLGKLKNYTEFVIAYTNSQIDHCKSLNQGLFQQAEERSVDYPPFITYIKGLLKVVFICQRLITLIKSCCIRINSNIVKTLKNCKDIKNRFACYIQSEYGTELFPSTYSQLLRQGVSKNKSLYDIHIEFSEANQRRPICQICLYEINKKGEQYEQKGWYHYVCFNLIKSISSLDYI